MSKSIEILYSFFVSNKPIPIGKIIVANHGFHVKHTVFGKHFFYHFITARVEFSNNLP